MLKHEDKDYSCTVVVQLYNTNNENGIWFCRIRGDQQHFVRRDELKVKLYKQDYIIWLKWCSSKFDGCTISIVRLHGRSLHHFCIGLTVVKWSRSHMNQAAEVLHKQMNFWQKLVMFKRMDISGFLPRYRNAEWSAMDNPLSSCHPGQGFQQTEPSACS